MAPLYKTPRMGTSGKPPEKFQKKSNGLSPLVTSV